MISALAKAASPNAPELSEFPSMDEFAEYDVARSRVAGIRSEIDGIDADISDLLRTRNTRRKSARELEAEAIADGVPFVPEIAPRELQALYARKGVLQFADRLASKRLGAIPQEITSQNSDGLTEALTSLVANAADKAQEYRQAIIAIETARSLLEDRGYKAGQLGIPYSGVHVRLDPHLNPQADVLEQFITECREFGQ